MRPAEPTNPSRAPRIPPRTHISPPIHYHDTSIKYAPARRPHEIMATQYTPRPRPIPKFASPTIVLLATASDLSTGLWDDRRLSTFLRCIALVGLNFVLFFGSAIWVRLQLPCDTLYTVHQHFIPPILVSSACNVAMVLCRSLESRMFALPDTLP